MSRVIVPFAVDPAESTPFTRGSHRARLSTYYRSSIATFGTLRRFNPRLECIFATNVTPPDPVVQQFGRLDVRIAHVDARLPQTRPPGTIFRTSLYLFDVLRAGSIPDGGIAVYLDPDVLCVRPITFALQDGRVGCLPLATGPHDSIKGLSLTQIAGISARLGRPQDSIPRHIGGEILAVTPAALPTLLERIEGALSCRADDGTPVFLNEEHVLTYASDSSWSSMRSLVARIWTAPRYRDVPDDATALALWHLPAEKTRGLRPVHRAVRRRLLERLPDDAVRRFLGLRVGVIPTRRRAISDRVLRAVMPMVIGLQ